jgi:hypothetical protein
LLVEVLDKLVNSEFANTLVVSASHIHSASLLFFFTCHKDVVPLGKLVLTDLVGQSD